MLFRVEFFSLFDDPLWAREKEKVFFLFFIHEDVTDIKVAYYAVKGELSENEAAKRASRDQAEYAKNQALNAGGGGGTAGYFPEGVDPADVFIAGRSNPNVF